MHEKSREKHSSYIPAQAIPFEFIFAVPLLLLASAHLLIYRGHQTLQMIHILAIPLTLLGYESMTPSPVLMKAGAKPPIRCYENRTGPQNLHSILRDGN